MQESYNPKDLEKEYKKNGIPIKILKPSQTKIKSFTVYLCSHIQVEIFISVMSETIQ